MHTNLPLLFRCIVASTLGAACTITSTLSPAGDAGTPIPTAKGDAGVRIARTGFTRTVCGYPLDALLAKVTPAVAVDALELRSQYPLADGGTGFNPLGTTGEACKTASNKAACVTSFQNAKTTGTGWAFTGEVPSNRYFAFTRADTVGTVGTKEELREFLKPFEVDHDGALALSMEAMNFDCEQPNVRDVAEGREYIAYSGNTCGAGAIQYEHRILVKADGTTEEREKVISAYGDPSCAIGRLPAEYPCENVAASTNAAEYLARVAELEAASVFAFRRLSCELTAFGAPADLALRARTSADEEIDHARQMRRACERWGGTPREAHSTPLAVRTLLAMALENATEGCVRETYGAVVAAYQAARATDDALRESMTQIAADEAGHAALSWDIHTWVMSRLSEEEKTQVEEAQRATVSALRASIVEDESAGALAALGLPNKCDAENMFSALADHLWLA